MSKNIKLCGCGKKQPSKPFDARIGCPPGVKGHRLIVTYTDRCVRHYPVSKDVAAVLTALGVASQN